VTTSDAPRGFTLTAPIQPGAGSNIKHVRLNFALSLHPGLTAFVDFDVYFGEECRPTVSEVVYEVDINASEADFSLLLQPLVDGKLTMSPSGCGSLWYVHAGR